MSSSALPPQALVRIADPAKSAHMSRAARFDTYEPHSDCDSEGNDPPSFGEFINPLTVDETIPPPKSAAQESKLPLSQPVEQRRIREAYEPPISYEDWIEGDDAVMAAGRLAAGQARRDIKRLEDDSDFPLGRPYAYHAFCPNCNRTYYPVVPSGWKCLKCSGPVWQQPEDPDSKRCAVCRREVAKNRKIFHMKIQNPLALNPHVCKRCGRIVCDQCYSPVPVSIDEYGYKGPQRVCTVCVQDIDMLAQPPIEEDMGTLHDEDALREIDDEANYLPYWPPKCSSCSMSAAVPPKRWECEMCGQHMWQPLNVQESQKCWICSEPNPQSRCHRCGQLACKQCGAYAQPLPELGFTNGAGLSVCKVCYTGVATSVVPERYTRMVREELETRMYLARCSQCKAPQSNPKQWLASCHKTAPCWEVGATECSLCTTPLREETAQHCRSCGHAVCIPCAQYKCPLPQRGYPASDAQTICRACFHPQEALLPDHCDTRQWPPYCPVCSRSYDVPPDRWRCVNDCGNVWQPVAHIASLTCYCCGSKVGNPINCRRCGRIVCTTCGKNKTELVDLGFTRGQTFPTCNKCVEWVKQNMGDEAERAKMEQEAHTRAEAERQKRLAERPQVPRNMNPPGPGIPLAAPPGRGQLSPSQVGGPTGSEATNTPQGQSSTPNGGPRPPGMPLRAPSGAPSGTGTPKGPPPGWKGPPPGWKGPPPGWKGPPPGTPGYKSPMPTPSPIPPQA